MSIIEVALKALDFHIYDRQGHELTLWHSPRDDGLSGREAVPGIHATGQESHSQPVQVRAPGALS